MRSNIIAYGAGLALCALVASSARALPKYATKEKKPCSFCHTAKAGGGRRTTAGDWYKTHNHTFAGWKPGASQRRP